VKTRSAAVLAVLATGVLVLPGCGGEAGARKAVEETSANLGRIRSGELDARLLIAARGGENDGALGFEVKGPFALPARPGLPTARVAYTQIAGRNEATTTLLATGREAFVEMEGTPYRLPRRETQRLELAGDVRGASGGGLRVERWLRDPQLEDGPRVAGVPTDRVTGDLDVPRAANDLLGLADRAGAEAAGIEPLRGARAEDLEESVRSGRIELLTGTEDRLLRRLKVDLELDAPRPKAGGSLPRLDAVKIDFDLSLSRANEPVRVAAPSGARPLEELEKPR
jgi:hypothetical protein